MSGKGPTALLPFSDGLPPHLPCGPGDIAPDVLMPGDPDRVSLLGEMLYDVTNFGRKREYAVITGHYKGRCLTICSSGIGGPSTEIAMVELAALGARRIVRIGGMSALMPEIELGSYVVVERAIGMSGVAALYNPHSTPAMADANLVDALFKAAEQQGYKVRRGILASTDSYYRGQDRPLDSNNAEPMGKYLNQFLSKGAVGCDMEAQSVLAVGRMLGIRAACLLGTHGNRATNAWLLDYEETQRNLLHIAGLALINLDGRTTENFR